MKLDYRRRRRFAYVNIFTGIELLTGGSEGYLQIHAAFIRREREKEMKN